MTLDPGVSAYVVPRQTAALDAQFVIVATAGVGAGVSDGVCVGVRVSDAPKEGVRDGVGVGLKGVQAVIIALPALPIALDPLPAPVVGLVVAPPYAAPGFT